MTNNIILIDEWATGYNDGNWDVSNILFVLLLSPTGQQMRVNIILEADPSFWESPPLHDLANNYCINNPHGSNAHPHQHHILLHPNRSSMVQNRLRSDPAPNGQSAPEIHPLVLHRLNEPLHDSQSSLSMGEVLRQRRLPAVVPAELLHQLQL